jgi:hypothetical protein
VRHRSSEALNLERNDPLLIPGEPGWDIGDAWPPGAVEEADGAGNCGPRVGSVSKRTGLLG